MTPGDSGNSARRGQLRVTVSSQTSVTFAVQGCGDALVALTEVPGKLYHCNLCTEVRQYSTAFCIHKSGNSRIFAIQECSDALVAITEVPGKLIVLYHGNMCTSVRQVSRLLYMVR